ncbi:OLC1v1031060C1 [Oldenlandia corymbosa var. corymbosa]|uniref:OLC1v1031060C1 n=1 Tax=Oldenlandia corymbosa var. corymbosa TaxID=529605 RepID=A0AAV1CL11_OLDCO|nr:OLC1v1031060C1 [Oldenlandia corymbosa var. corymbosa]
MALAVENGRVGSLVWVLRKNGRWWPGKIEASSNSKVAVKLLGKQNGYVEWVNLASSKRVKAFRSVEFDDFIRSAELSNTANYRKNAKYPNREDAILHALSLEQQEKQRSLKRPGVFKQSALCRAKRSRCAYLPVESNSHVNRSVLHSRTMRVLSALRKLDENSLYSSQGEVQDSSESAASDVSESSSEDSGFAENGKLTGSYTNGRKRRTTNVQKAECFSNSSKSSLDNKFAVGAEQNRKLKERCYSHDSSASPDTMTEGESSMMSRKQASNTKDQWMLDVVCLEEIRHKAAKKSSKNLALEVENQSDSSSKAGDSCSESLCCSPVYNDDQNMSKPMLVDVPVTVEAKYRNEHVPLVSLMSKLGKAPIIGYPVEVEVLDNIPEDLLPRKGSTQSMIDNVGTKLHLPIWKTSKRTPVSYVGELNSSATQTPEAEKNGVLQAGSSLLKPHRKGDFSLKNGHSSQTSFRKRGGSISSLATSVPVNLIFSQLYSAICT